MTNLLPIKTNKILIRDFQEDDWKFFQKIYKFKECYVYQKQPEATEEIAKKDIKNIIEKIKENPRKYKHSFAVCDIKTENVIGYIGFHHEIKEKDDAEIYYTFLPEIWGKGYATESLKAMIQIGFEKFKLHRVTSVCHFEHNASYRVMEKAGMIREGRLRKSYLLNDKWYDAYIYAIVDDEEYDKVINYK